MDANIVTEKKCRSCEKTKPFAMFSKHRVSKYGFNSICKICKAKQDSEYAKKNKEKVNEKKKKWAIANKEKIKLAKAKWQQNNKSFGAKTTAKYRYNKHNATVLWADFSAIEIEYELAAWCTKVTGEKYHVDHIIPIQGKNVCGLHVHNNLRVVLASENISKSNKFDVL